MSYIYQMMWFCFDQNYAAVENTSNTGVGVEKDWELFIGTGINEAIMRKKINIFR